MKQKVKESSIVKAVSTPTPEPVEPTNNTRKLPQEALDNMVKFINDGKISDVEKAMKKYDLTEAQNKLLTTLINQEKAKKLKDSAKKK
jgi:hypothetical protein